MAIDHDTLVWFSKIVRPVLPDRRCRSIVVAYAFWPSNRKQFDAAPQRILAGRRQAMAVEERDPHTGYLTTGHEWNGIKELNTPVPRLVYFFLIVTRLFAVGYWLLMPAWPLGSTYTKGLLGADDRARRSRQR